MIPEARWFPDNGRGGREKSCRIVGPAIPYRPEPTDARAVSGPSPQGGRSVRDRRPGKGGDCGEANHGSTGRDHRWSVSLFSP
jgi:hypothetical protein